MILIKTHITYLPIKTTPNRSQNFLLLYFLKVIDRLQFIIFQILVNSARWPLIIDPQLQGIKWIKNKYGDDLQIVRLGQKSCLDVIERAMSDGATVCFIFQVPSHSSLNIFYLP